jgi:hypothetical protein
MEYPTNFEVNTEDLPMIEAFAKWVEICELMPDSSDPEVQAALMQACWLVQGPAGVSKSDIFPKNAIVETITIPVPKEWEMFSTLEEEDEEREQETRDEFWKNWEEK